MKCVRCFGSTLVRGEPKTTEVGQTEVTLLTAGDASLYWFASHIQQTTMLQQVKPSTALHRAFHFFTIGCDQNPGYRRKSFVCLRGYLQERLPQLPQFQKRKGPAALHYNLVEASCFWS